MNSAEAMKARDEDQLYSYDDEAYSGEEAVSPDRLCGMTRFKKALPRQRRAAAQVWAYLGAFIGHRYTVFTMRMLLGSIFLVSACGKLVDITQYSIKPVGEFGILPHALVPLVGSVLPFAELLCALGLVSGVLMRLSAFGAALMSATFLAAKLFLLAQGGDFSCGCFGAVVTTFASLTVYLDPPMLFAALAVMLSPGRARDWLSLKRRRRDSKALTPNGYTPRDSQKQLLFHSCD